LAEDARFDVIASGSMLGVAYKEMQSVPVGYESQVEMFSLDFEEFLWAKGFDSEKIGIVKEYFDRREKVPPSSNDIMIQHMREYMIVGGMPAVVKRYIETGDFSRVHKEQTQIIDSYLDDIAKYAPLPERPKARNCYLSLPRQLAKENKKFQYSVVEKNGTARKFDNSIEWLRDAGVIKLCTNVETPVFPLPAYEKRGYFKAYASDIGLLAAMYGFEVKAAIYSNTLKGAAKGGIYENLLADVLVKKYQPLYYYKPGENRQEIEFLYTQGDNIIPIEVKAGNNPSPSLDAFIKEFAPPYGLKLISGNVGQVGDKLTLPLYMAMFL
jgi:predicted AAA+ superfamily ATPase